MHLDTQALGLAAWARSHTRAITIELPGLPSDLNLGSHRDEFLALAHERDPEIYYQSLLHLGMRLADENRLDSAGQIFTYLTQPTTPEVPNAVQERARGQINALTGAGSNGPRTEFLLRRLSREAMEPTMLVGLTAASAAFRMTRLATFSRLAASPSMNFLTRGFGAQTVANLAGFGVEATIFPLATRGAAVALGRDLDWSSSQIGGEIAGSFIVLGAMKLVGWGLPRLGHGRFLRGGAGPTLQTLLRQTGMLAGIALGHHLETLAGLRPHVDGATTFIDSLAMLVQLNVAGRLAHGAMGPGFSRWERGLDIHMESLRRHQPTFRWPPGPSFRPVELLLAPAGPGIRMSERETPDLIRNNILMMSRGRGSGTERPKVLSLESMLRHIGFFRDVRSAKLGLRALWIGVVGPLQAEIITTLEKIDGGGDHRTLVRELGADPRVKTTRFLSQDLQRRLSEQIQDLRKTGGNRDSGVFFHNLMQGLLEDFGNPRDPNQPVKLTAEALLPLQQIRLQELEKLLADPNATLSLSAREALAEGVQVARAYDRVIQGLMKRKGQDFLTQLRNRADVDRLVPRLEYRLQNFLRYSGPLRLEDHVMMMDLDKFKDINDTYGHQVGDEVLQETAEILRDSEVIRPRDIIARYGGEEFLSFLFKTGRKGAEIVSERVRRSFEEHSFEVEGHDPLKVTISIGVAPMIPLPSAEPGGSPVITGAFHHALGLADQAALAAKNTGRNRVVFYGDPHIDWATCLYNHTGLQSVAARLESGLATALGGSYPDVRENWVVMFDIDRMELINFAYGEATGDKVLWNIAQSLRTSLSGTPYVSARYSGDRFFVHLRTSDREEATATAERIRKGAARRETAVEGRTPIRATVSLGLAPMRPVPPLDGDGPPQVEGALQNAIERGMRAMAIAKQSGRNKVVVSDE